MRKQELSALTGIRFYAAFFVFLSHVVIIPGMEALSGPRLVFNAGVVGVSFFFVLSGFILTYNYAQVFRDGVSATAYKRFIRDRLSKIYPVHVLTLLLVLPVAAFSPNLPMDWRALPFHLTLLQCFLPFSTPPFHDYLNVPSWSISCEWFFYLLAPMTIFLVMDKKRRLVPVLMAGAYCLLGWFLWTGDSDFSRLYFVSWFAPSRFPEFLVGVFLGSFYLRTPSWKREELAGFAQAAGIVLIVAGAMARAHAPWPLWGGLLYVPGSALLVLGLAYGRGFFVAHLSRPWLNRLGMASFSLYMVHAPILRIARAICLRLGWEVHSWIAFALVTAFMFVMVQGVALVMLSRYELPLQRRLRSLVPFTPVHQLPRALSAHE
jgi:peptidoglycan/LPS O-acetylase OafA/YrhL